MKKCVLDETKSCNNCGDCDDRCELDPTKVCDNCFKCLEPQGKYATIKIEGVYLDDSEV